MAAALVEACSIPFFLVGSSAQDCHIGFFKPKTTNLAYFESVWLANFLLAFWLFLLLHEALDQVSRRLPSAQCRGKGK